jgi:hypothetical protein
MEEFNKPGVAMCNRGFMTDAKAAASGRGMPGVKIIATDIACECTVTEEIDAGVDAVLDEIIDAFTKPLSAEEKAPIPKQIEILPNLVFNGTLEEVNRFYYRRGWGDGLPIIPPTEKAVQEMLTGTDLPANTVIGKIVPRLGKATVEKIAINAVMAGALPTYMPILIAGVRALLDPRSFFSTFEVSTGSWIPFWIVNGPIRNDLHINSGSGALSPGDIANAAIGRAMGLIIKNIGGARKGIEDMGCIGNPGKYTMVLAENEEESPWEPLHVQQKLDKRDSAITVFFPNCITQAWPFSSDANGILHGVTLNIKVGRRGLFGLTLLPAHAKALADKGWSKKEIAGYISQHARVPAYDDPGIYGPLIVMPPKHYMSAHPMGTTPILPDPDWIRVIVAGGPGNFMGLFAASWFPGCEFVTQKVDLPANWDKLVKKYKDIVPTHVRY